MKLADLQEKVMAVSLDFLGESVEFGLKPGKVTQAALNAMYGFGMGPSEDPSLEFLCDVIAYWDIVDGKGERLPVTIEVLKQLPVALISQIPAALRKELDSQGNS